MKKIDDFVTTGQPIVAGVVKMDQPVITEVVQQGGTTTVTSESKIVKGRVERVTGAGHFVVYPNENEITGVKTGDQVMVLTDMKLYLDITLEVVKEPVLSPYSSTYTIVVKGRNRQLESCMVYCKGEKLFANDATGNPKSELPLALGGTLYFRIPDTLKPEGDSIVEIREGEVVIYEKFGSIPGSAFAI